MRILVVGPYYADTGLGVFYVRALQRLGHDVQYRAFQEKVSSQLGGLPRLSASLASRWRPYQRHVMAAGLQRLLALAAEWRPQLVLVVHGDALSAETLHELRAHSGAVLFHIYPDNPWVAARRGVSSFWDTLPSYDCVVTYARFLVPGLYQRGARRVEFVPFAYDPETHQPRLTSGEERALYASPVAYLGTWGPVVERWLEPVAPFGLKIWGYSWEKLKPGSPLAGCWQRPGPQELGHGAGMSKVCPAADVVVNFIRAEHGCAHSMKTFELPACGAFLLCTRTAEQLEFLPEDECAVYFWTQEEMVDKLRFYLAHPAARERIRLAGMERVRPHTYVERSRQLLRIWSEISGVPVPE